MTASLHHTAEDLARFRQAQRLAYDCAETIAGELRPGITERQVAALENTCQRNHGTLCAG